MKKSESLQVQIEKTQRELQAAKPRSTRHAELELRLRDLRTQQLRYENRMKGSSAA